MLTALLRAADVAELPAPARARYRERVQCVEGMMRRLVYDVEQYFSELRDRAANRTFDAEKFRAEWTKKQQETEQ